MIDAYTRFSVATFIKRKTTSSVAEAVLTHWFSVFGPPARIWTDLGKEFCSDEIKEIGELLNIELGTAGGMAPWMNGLCERNHQITDVCLEKMLSDTPNLSPEVALAWACNAKNTLNMNNGFSSHQLVFGKNPNMPEASTDNLPALTGVPTYKSLAEHLQAIHLARKAYVASQNDEKIRRALRHKVRSVEKPYTVGEKVYYKRDDQGIRWRGPASVIGIDGKVLILKHQESILRVASCRVQPVEQAVAEEEEKSVTNTDQQAVALHLKDREQRVT